MSVDDLATVGHNGGPPLDDIEPARAEQQNERWYDLRLLRMNGKPRCPMERSTSRTPLWCLSGDEKPLLGRRIRGWEDINNSLEGGPLRQQRVTPYRVVPMKPRQVERLDAVANRNSTKRLPFLEEVRAGRLTQRQGEVISKGIAVRSSILPQLAVCLNSVLQKARAGAEMKEFVPAHVEVAAKRQAEAGRIVLRAAADAAAAGSEAKVYSIAKAASDALLALRKKPRGGARAGAGRKAKSANDNYLTEYKKSA